MPDCSLRLLTVDLSRADDPTAGLARLVEQHRPDVAVVHGAPSLLRWRSACAALAREAGLVTIGGGRTGGGNLLLSTLGVDVDAARDLAFTGHRGPRPPGATVAALRRRGAPLAAAAARVQGSPTERLSQVQQLLSAVAEVLPAAPPPVLAVSGVELGTSTWTALADGRTAVAGVFVDERITVDGDEELSGGARRLDLTVPG